MEDRRKKRSDTWDKICKSMLESGVTMPNLRLKVEQKWRNLMKSHKNIIQNRKTTGKQRKDFQFFAEIEDIVAKRHDINPPLVAGSGCSKLSEAAQCVASRPRTSSPKSTRPSNEEEEDISLFGDVSGISEQASTSQPSTSQPSTSQPSTSQRSTSKSAERRRKKRKIEAEEDDVQMQTLQFLKDMEKSRREEAERREENRERREELKMKLLEKLVNSLDK